MGRDKAITNKIMSSIPSKDTKPEMVLRRRLFQDGYRYRVNYKKLVGRPDIVFTKVRLAVFVDGDFWHGHNWAIRGYESFEEELKRYSDYWRTKIVRNVERDKDVTIKLEDEGWTVLRIWESDIKKDEDAIVKRIEDLYAKLSEGLIE